MKTRCSIKGASLKAEIIKEEHGDSHIDTYWLVIFKIPADSIDANEINNMVGAEIDLTAETVQLSMDLPKPKKARAVA